MMGEKVTVADLQPGDAVFFGSPVHHVGIYVGGGYFIHAPRTGDYVKISRLSDRYDYAGARRYAWVARAGEPLNATKSTDRGTLGRLALGTPLRTDSPNPVDLLGGVSLLCAAAPRTPATHGYSG